MVEIKLNKDYSVSETNRIKNKDVSLNYRYLWYNLLAYRQDKITGHCVFLL